MKMIYSAKKMIGVMTMRKRDKEIIQTLQLFRAMTRDQIAELFYGYTKSPSTNANFALKRLRDRGYIEADVTSQPYTYFPKPSRIKVNGQKVEHFLKITDFYLQLLKHGEKDIKHFSIEPQFPNIDVRPDIFMLWRGTYFFTEVQNTHYTQKVMQQKINRYEAFMKSNEWKECLPFKVKNFPTIWIIADHTYNVKSDYVRIVQSKDVNTLLARMKPKKETGISIKIG